MTPTPPTRRRLALALALSVSASACLDPRGDRETGVALAAAAPGSAAADHGRLYGRVTTADGATYEGHLRWGADEEAFWGDYFNGFKHRNPWARFVPPARRPGHWPIEILGVTVVQGDLGRPFMARFGDLARIEAEGRDFRVTLKSGTTFTLDRFSADDLADGVRVWDRTRGVVDLDEWRIRRIDFLPTGPVDSGAHRLHGTVHTRHGAFTGFVQWDREDGVGTDELVGQAPDGEHRLRFDAIHAIARDSRDSALVTLADGREVVLSGTRAVGQGNRGLYVDDPRYGRVLVSWDAFERLDFTPGGRSPAYDEFPPGHALAGAVTTRDGRRLAGRLVFDLDESETTETLDAPSRGVHYTLPFGLVASIVVPGPAVPRATVVLYNGEALPLERSGDLGDQNAGLLIFVGGSERPEYVPWRDVQRIDFDGPGMPPPARHPRG